MKSKKFREFLLPIAFVMYYNIGQEVNISHFHKECGSMRCLGSEEIFTSEKEKRKEVKK
ncbi:MAG: hypothetical protein HFH36_03745 [Lachnospiraceae bacterium]|nr:hypothetical protein [Lachnospiraceae bacterium]